MASTASTNFSCPISIRKFQKPTPRRVVLVLASDSADDPTTTRRNPTVDTRIHWSNPDEGWIGGKSSGPKKSGTQKSEPLGERFADLINRSTSSHYQLSVSDTSSTCDWFLGVKAEADMEEIKAAYRKLSKEYHPDTTSLPLKAASEKFIQLREAYNVLSKEDTRNFYDWTLAQEAESRRAQRMRMRLEDPYEQDLENWESIPDTVDRLGGKNMKLSDQAMTALTFDAIVVVIAICSIIYVSIFQPSY